MLTNHAKIMQFFSVVGEVTGRKKLQKMIYILQTCGVPFEEKYQFHFYGPYSEELSLRMEELCNLGFIQEEKEDKSNYTQYHYHITDHGKEFLQHFQSDMPDFSDKAMLLLDESSRFLELLATMLFFQDLSREAVEEKVDQVKPKQKYSREEMARAWQLMDTLIH